MIQELQEVFSQYSYVRFIFDMKRNSVCGVIQREMYQKRLVFVIFFCSSWHLLDD